MTERTRAIELQKKEQKDKKYAKKIRAVESILDKRFINKKTRYLVKWKNFPANKCTWETFDHLYGCRELLRMFEDRLIPTSVDLLKGKEEDKSEKGKKTTGGKKSILQLDYGIRTTKYPGSPEDKKEGKGKGKKEPKKKSTEKPTTTKQPAKQTKKSQPESPSQSESPKSKDKVHLTKDDKCRILDVENEEIENKGKEEKEEDKEKVKKGGDEDIEMEDADLEEIDLENSPHEIEDRKSVV